MFRRHLALALAASLLCVSASVAQDDEGITNPRKAVKKYSRAVEKAPDDADSWYNLGVAYLLLEEWNDAVEATAKAVELSPENSRAHFRHGEALAGAGRTGDSVDSFAKAAELDPTLLPAHLRLGNMALDAGDTDAAIEAFKNALRAKPENPAPVYSSLGGAYMAAGEFDQALKWLERTIENDQDDPAANFNLAVTLRRAGKAQGKAELTRRAAELFGRAAELDPDNAKFHFYAGETLLWVGDNEPAKVHLERARELDRDLAPELRQATAEYLQLLGS